MSITIVFRNVFKDLVSSSPCPTLQNSAYIALAKSSVELFFKGVAGHSQNFCNWNISFFSGWAFTSLVDVDTCKHLCTLNWSISASARKLKTMMICETQCHFYQAVLTQGSTWSYKCIQKALGCLCIRLCVCRTTSRWAKSSCEGRGIYIGSSSCEVLRRNSHYWAHQPCPCSFSYWILL